LVGAPPQRVQRTPIRGHRRCLLCQVADPHALSGCGRLPAQGPACTAAVTRELPWCLGASARLPRASATFVPGEIYSPRERPGRRARGWPQEAVWQRERARQKVRQESAREETGERARSSCSSLCDFSLQDTRCEILAARETDAKTRGRAAAGSLRVLRLSALSCCQRRLSHRRPGWLPSTPAQRSAAWSRG